LEAPSESSRLTFPSEVMPNAPRELSEAINALVGAYLAAIDSVALEKVISIRGLAIAYWRVVVWEFGIVLLLPIMVINLASRFLAWCFSQRPRLIWNFGWEYSIDTLKAFNRGEVPLLELVVFRYFTRRFVVSHIRRRLNNIAAFLEQKEVFAAFSSNDANQGDIIYPALRRKLVRLRAVLKRSGPFRFIILLSPVVGIISKFIGVDFPKFLYSKMQSAGVIDFHGFTAGAASEHGLRWPLLSLLGQMLLGVGITLISSFIAKRRIFLKQDIFPLEEAVFRTQPSMRPRELPIDLIGYPFLFALYFALFFSVLFKFRESGSLSQPGSAAAMDTAILAVPFLYALYHRVRVGRR
jgi:hypothetical protein